jgi:outer membrane immunogenic protein
VTNIKQGNFYVDNVSGSEAANSQNVRAGWTVGGGLEWGLNRSWSVKAEYLYMDFGSVTTQGFISSTLVAGIANGLSVSSHLSVQTARVGLNYRLGGSP